jgi:Xaa-Pro aminopeptidase
MNYASRVRRLQAEIQQPLLITNLINIRYLTGFTGSSAFLYLFPEGGTFLTDGRYGEVADGIVSELPGIELDVYTSGLFDCLATAIASADQVGLEATNVTWDFVHTLRDKTTAKLTATKGVVEAHRRVKDADEVEALRRAAAAGDLAFSELDGLLMASLTEGELGDGLIATMKAAGAEQAGWPPIVAVGPHAARPHHRSGDGAMADAGLLLLDYGCVVDGYHSDMSRTTLVGDIDDPEIEKVHTAVLESNEAGIAAVGPGVTAGDVDMVCREVLARHGYEDYFVHSTGHGVGLEIHEAPWVRKGSTDVLEPGNVVTVEPGVYLPGRFGVRIEDMVHVTEGGHEVLTMSSKELRPQ